MADNNIIRSFYEAINSKDHDKIVSFFTDDAQFVDTAMDHTFRGKSEIRAMCESWMKAFPDLKLQPKNMLGDGDLFACELMLSGTQQGPLEGPMGSFPASNKRINVPSCDVFRLQNGKIKMMTTYFALPVMLKQLGVLQGRRAA